MVKLRYTGPHQTGGAAHEEAVPAGEIGVMWTDDVGGGYSETVNGELECTPEQAKHLLTHQPTEWAKAGKESD